MSLRSRVLSLILGPTTLVLIYSGACQSAATTAAVSVNCTSTNRTAIQTAVNQATPSVITTITVSGSCIDNIEIPTGKNIIIKGNTGASLTPAVVSKPALSVYGGIAVIQSMSVTGANITDSLLFSGFGGSLKILASSISAANSSNFFSTIFAQNNASVIISNSIVKATGGTIGSRVINITRNSSLIVKADGADVLNGFSSNTATTNISANNSSNSVGIECSDSSSVTLAAGTGANSSTPQLTIQKAKAINVYISGCSASINNNTSNISAILIKNDSGTELTNGIGLIARDSSIRVSGAKFANNARGIVFEGSNASLNWSEFSSNSVSCGNDLTTSCDLFSRLGSYVKIYPNDDSLKINTFTGANLNNLFCAMGGNIYIRNGTSNPTNLDLTAGSPYSCVAVETLP